MNTLDALAAKAGIQESYTDIWDKVHHVSPQTKEAMVKALGITQDTALPEVHVVEMNRPCEKTIYGKAVQLPALDMGYHRWEQDGRVATIIAAPARCWLPDDIAQGKRFWGVASQLYGVRSDRNWGMGDFTDLANLAEGAGALGADVLGINPLHASYPSDPHQFSPYAPSNREFLNYLYIDPAKLPGGEGDAAEQATLRNADMVDYIGIAKAKRAALESAFVHFRQHEDQTDFAAFVLQQGEALQHQAAFDALSEHFSEAGWFREWPEAFQNPRSAEVAGFIANHAERIEFYSWLQFVADTQLAEAQQAAHNAGMTLGLYRDLAVGSAGGGAEIWLHPDRFVRGVTVGAPPDALNAKGQNWGLPPFNPVVMVQQGMQPFIDLLRANMRHAGALRIDHAFGLARLFWVPEGVEATQGAYVTYPFEAMLAVLRVESHRNRCLVIGEDLGTFPPGYKEKAAAAGVLSYRVLYFEREADGGFIAPENYPSLALATVSTHDLPTLMGWESGWDLETKTALDLYPSAAMDQQERTNREADRLRLQNALVAQNLDAGDLLTSAHRYLARSPAALVMVQLEDVLQLQEQANMPATIDEHPNWRRKLPQTLEQITDKHGALSKLGAALALERQQLAPSYPLATYRLQLHKGFTFDDAEAIVPYLAELGVSHVYTSPITQARSGSSHGYDVADYSALNADLGGVKAYARFCDTMREYGLRHLVDFVPNHMGIGNDNQWWQHVLAHGEQSPYARFFDIDWRQKLLVPVLGGRCEDVIAKGELSVLTSEDVPVLVYYGQRFALHPDSHAEAKKAVAPDAVQALLDKQSYRLAHWHEAASHINYRRFFEINELAGVRVEDRPVFESVHALVFDLLDKAQVDALRIDHIDGLADPAAYLQQVQQRVGPNRYVVVEKILGHGEQLPSDWPVAGTSGYEVLNLINGVFVQQNSEAAFTHIYAGNTGQEEDFAAEMQAAKWQVLQQSFQPEWQALTRCAAELADAETEAEVLQQALGELIVGLPVYRTYATSHHISEHDRRLIADVLDASSLDAPVRAAVLAIFARGDAEFLRRFQQLSGPVMAKGLEDTSFYRYQRFVALNEVGGEPQHFGLSIADFHAANRERVKRWPHNMVTTATHDTKRGEDMRARLTALSVMPAAWEQALEEWQQLEPLTIHPADAYLLYQTMLGSWPLELMQKPWGEVEVEAYRQRLHDYMVKALREGKQRSSWLEPDVAYEKAIGDAVDMLLDSADFTDVFLPFVRNLAEAGMRNSLAQTTLKLTLPGVPDIYQGSEQWDFSLVDPDNRRPVDYAARLTVQQEKSEDWNLMYHRWPDGAVKQQLVQVLLQHRKANRGLYGYGNYVPLTVQGEGGSQWLAFMRCHEGHTLLVAIRCVATGELLPAEIMWEAQQPATRWRNVLTQQELKLEGTRLSLSCGVADLPVVVLEAVA